MHKLRYRVTGFSYQRLTNYGYSKSIKHGGAHCWHAFFYLHHGVKKEYRMSLAPPAHAPTHLAPGAVVVRLLPDVQDCLASHHPARTAAETMAAAARSVQQKAGQQRCGYQAHSELNIQVYG